MYAYNYSWRFPRNSDTDTFTDLRFSGTGSGTEGDGHEERLLSHNKAVTAGGMCWRVLASADLFLLINWSLYCRNVRGAAHWPASHLCGDVVSLTRVHHVSSAPCPAANGALGSQEGWGGRSDPLGFLPLCSLAIP